MKNEWIHKGDFKVTEDMVRYGEMIKSKIPYEVTGHFKCSDMHLITLRNSPSIVHKSFNCKYNNLTSLKELKLESSKGFFCNGNLLTTLKGCPKEIKGLLDCSHNNLKSLEYGPKILNGSVHCLFNINSLQLERGFIEQGYNKNNYHLDLLTYFIKYNMNVNDIETWPVNFLNDNILKSVKSINKFNL